MLKKIKFKIFKVFNISIIYQLVLSPYALAQKPPQKESSFFSWDTVEKVLPTAVGFTNNFLQAFMQSQATQQPQDMYSQFKNRFDSTLALRPIDPRNVKGGALFAGCIVLPAQTNRLQSGQRCSSQPPQSIQAGYAAALIDTMEFNLAQIEKFKVKGNDNVNTQGVGCYDKKLEDFETLLKQREIEVDKYAQRLENLLDDFKLASRNDLESIKRSAALLDGGPNADKYLKDFNFGDMFTGKNDPSNVCGSVVSKGEFQKEGRKSRNGGLRAIEKLLEAKTETPENLPGSRSPKDMLAQDKQLKKEILSLSSKISKNFISSGANEVRRGLSSISHNGKLISKDNKAVQNVIQNFNIGLKNQMDNLDSEMDVTSKIEGVPGLENHFNSVRNKRVDFDELESKLTRLENQSKRSCLTKTISDAGFGSINNFVKRFVDPQVSKSMQREADNPLANDIINAFNNNEDINEFIESVEASQAQGGNYKYIMRTGKQVNIGSTKISASTPMRPYQFLSIFVDVCNKNHKAKNPNNSSGYSMADSIEAIRNYAAQKESIRRVAGSNISKKITTNLLSCPQDTTTGKAVNSCQGALNVNSSNFCLRTAKTCASNTIGCYEKTKAKLKQVRSDQLRKVANYNQNVNRFKNQMQSELLALNNFMEGQARSLDAQLNIGSLLGVPKLEFNFNQKKFLHENPNGEVTDTSLELEDPEAYLRDNLKNIENIKKNLVAQRKEMTQKLGQVKQQFVSNLDNSVSEIKQIIQECQASIGQVTEGLQKQQEEITENNKKTQQACQDLQAFNQSPNSFDEGEVDELAKTLSEVAQIAASAPGQGGQFVSANTAVDQATIARLRGFSTKCEENADELSLLNSKPGRLNANNVCFPENREKITELFPVNSDEIDRICDASKGENICKDEETWKKGISQVIGKNILCADGNTSVVLASSIDDARCQDGPDDSTDDLSPSKWVEKERDGGQISKAIGSSALPCSLPDEDNENNRSIREQLAAQYNCGLADKEMGEVRVSFCSFSNGSELNTKGKAIQDLGSALGQGMGARRN